MRFVVPIVVALITFSHHLVGIVSKPYETYRSITNRPKLFELLYVFIVCLGYFCLVSLIRVPAFRLHMLSKELVLLSGGTSLGFVLMVVSIWGIGLSVGGKGNIARVALGWGYSLIPTVLWFLLTSILYVLFPPPRTESIKGISFSLLYLLISSVLLFWKIELFYLTLRFGMRLSLKGILITSALIIPIIVIYTLGMYKLGIFNVPFI